MARLGSSSERFDLRRLGVAAPARRAPHVDHSPVEVYVVPGELAELARAQAERDREDEERFEPCVGVVGVVEAELGAAGAARRFLELSVETSVIVAFACGLVPHASSLAAVAAWVAP